MNEKISVIIPVYNVAPYLKQCIDSVINQTYTNLEIIVIDDGSTDGSGDICDEYAKNDQRIKVIHKTNGGLSTARNTGMDIATGTYLAFVDSDDWLDLNMYRLLVEIYQKYLDADLVTCGIVEEHHDKTVKTACESNSITVRSQKETYDIIFEPQYNVRFEVWNKLFRTDVVKNNRFVVGQVFEDVCFDYWILFNCNKIVTLDCSLYHYRMQRPGNTSSSFTWNRFSIFTELYKYILLFRQNGWNDLAEKYIIYSGETAISHYINAIACRSEDSVKSECLYWANFFKRISERPSDKLRLFCASSKLYIALRTFIQ